ncbi:YdcF family protein [Rhodococcus sp. BP-316]|jgi:vancomycin permeability regulator SanA|nr:MULTISPECIES: ElyC/SanA/YdcF family protein [unclassified Rhodococcus (in: high G+C Gram-positive bacteria)]MBY6683628.1 YdcF family protein [Rhodococcus sp. BP-316]MDQ1179895.1 SanA protein [Rhodococcus sp. SORGH_AS_0301]
MRRVGRRHLIRAVGGSAAAVLVVVLGSAAWVAASSHGRLYTADTAPRAPVAIVLGARVQEGEPSSFLAGRLDAALDLVRRGTVRALLLSGNAAGTSGDEVEVMTRYLVRRGVDPDRIVADPYGLTTHDTCRRAVATYGVSTALIVSQDTHAARAVALCRAAGIDAGGVVAPCDCSRRSLLRQFVREMLARPKAVLDVLRGSAPAVQSPPTDAVRRAVEIG